MNRPTWSETLPVWWSFFWRAALYGLIIGFVFGAIGGFMAAMSGSATSAHIYGQVGGILAGIPASLIALKQTLVKHGAAIAALQRTGVAA